MTEPIKFSFSRTASSATTAKKRPAEEEEQKDYVSGFSDKGELLSVEPHKKVPGGPAIIPLALQGHTKKSKSSTDTPTPAPSSQNNSDSAKTLDELAAEEIIRDITNQAKPAEVEGRTVPLTVQNQIEGLENITDEEERFKFDVASRPDEADEEAYEEMPIEEFGTAMLRGMGWTPGSAIGLNNKGLVEPIEYVKRPGYRLGLGATPKDVPVKKKKFIKPGESREPAPIMVAPTGPDGKVRHIKGIGEKLVPLKKGLQAGDLVGIVSGPHEGLYARIVMAGEDDDIVVRLESSSEDVVVAKSDVSIVNLSKLSEGHPALKLMMKEKRDRERERKQDEREESDSAYHKKDKESNGKHSSSSSKKSSESSSSRDDSGKTWIRPRIMVRVVSKSFENGKYYNKKVRILDVVGHNKCILQLDNGSLVEGVKQRMLETVIPPAGGKVMVVEGKNKGKVGTLLERKKGGDQESAVVQLMGDLTIESFPLDDVAQYVGTFDEEVVDLSVL